MTDTVFATVEVPVVETLVGEGKKFKDVEALAKGKLESDKHITGLEVQIKELRDELGKRLDGETELNKLRDELKSLREGKVDRPREVTTPELTATDVETLVEQTIAKREVVRTAEQNILDAHQEMVKHFGDAAKAKEHLEKKAMELGVSVAWLRDVAAKSPKAFLVQMDLKPISNQTNFSTGGVNIQALNSKVGDPAQGTKAYYDKMRQENPRKWMSPEIQLEIHQAAMEGRYFPKKT
jgi:hypothetical protein